MTAWTAADYRRDASDQAEEHNAAMAAEARDAWDEGRDFDFGNRPTRAELEADLRADEDRVDVDYDDLEEGRR